MSYAMSGALQAAIYGALTADPALSALVGADIYDAVPTGTVPDTYVSLGRESARDASDQTGAGAVHTIEISVITTQPGFAGAKKIAGAVSDVLHDADLTLERGRLIFLHFTQARAQRIDAAAGREIRLRFRARVSDE
ncbi:DUF3168 domain-containing protein [Roseobacter ponti]|uniref:DUF3168 domain-containing protein n=1 Tax=Roseobacter ponti TaxID=1891787 RepID=A0A858SS58_9RHOB|nr:DUF3168 domain-containing protein [Roseobacter ponti]QJF51505.1 DUF3168 domain-containing protein [Roseobacter ponti]